MGEPSLNLEFLCPFIHYNECSKKSQSDSPYLTLYDSPRRPYKRNGTKADATWERPNIKQFTFSALSRMTPFGVNGIMKSINHEFPKDKLEMSG